MPTYCYKCSSCNSNFEARHGMHYEDQVCIECGSLKIYKLPAIQLRKESPLFEKQKTGKIVDQYIEDTKREVKKEKRSLKEREL